MSSGDIRRIDDNAKLLGITPIQLMENAGKAVAEVIEKEIGNVKGRHIAVICGLGNNGGDGFVTARHLASKGAHVTVILLGRHDKIRTREALHNWKILEGMELSVKLHEVESVAGIKDYEGEIINADAVVDAIFGIGFKGQVGEPYRTAFEIMNRGRGLKIAIDVPSGINADTGEVGGIAFKADITVTFHAAKIGFKKAEEYVGKLVVKDIGIPEEAEYLVGLHEVRKVIRTRSPLSKKGDNGRVLVIGGSKLYSGAPALAGMAALRCGTDIVIIMAPRSVASIIKSFSPSLIVWPLRSEDYLRVEDVNDVLNVVEKFDCIIIGPGLGLNEETKEAVREIIESVKKPIIIDADALKAIKGSLDIISGQKAILTPHAGEFNILTGVDVSNKAWKERMEIVKDFSSKYEVITLLKGKIDIISDGREVRLNYTGNASMTVGGTGDTLTGIIASLVSKGNDLFLSACIGAFLNGLAGEIASGGKIYITPLDLIEAIPSAIRKIIQDRLILPSKVYENLFLK